MILREERVSLLFALLFLPLLPIDSGLLPPVFDFDLHAFVVSSVQFNAIIEALVSKDSNRARKPSNGSYIPLFFPVLLCSPSSLSLVRSLSTLLGSSARSGWLSGYLARWSFPWEDRLRPKDTAEESFATCLVSRNFFNLEGGFSSPFSFPVETIG